jgi:hypothetical protein
LIQSASLLQIGQGRIKSNNSLDQFQDRMGEKDPAVVDTSIEESFQRFLSRLLEVK